MYSSSRRTVGTPSLDGKRRSQSRHQPKQKLQAHTEDKPKHQALNGQQHQLATISTPPIYNSPSSWNNEQDDLRQRQQHQLPTILMSPTASYASERLRQRELFHGAHDSYGSVLEWSSKKNKVESERMQKFEKDIEARSDRKKCRAKMEHEAYEKFISGALLQIDKNQARQQAENDNLRASLYAFREDSRRNFEERLTEVHAEDNDLYSYAEKKRTDIARERLILAEGFEHHAELGEKHSDLERELAAHEGKMRKTWGEQARSAHKVEPSVSDDERNVIEIPDDSEDEHNEDKYNDQYNHSENCHDNYFQHNHHNYPEVEDEDDSQYEEEEDDDDEDYIAEDED